MEPKRMSEKNIQDGPRVIVSGGGTGGHIFPAISIANAVKKRWPNSEILFVGADNRMEMERVPRQISYRGLPVAGFDRKRPLKNIAVGVKLLRSMKNTRHHTDVQARCGCGRGWICQWTYSPGGAAKVPTLIQEQNSCAG